MSKSSMTRAVVAGALALVFAGSVLGLALAQQPSPTQGPGGPPRPGMQAFQDALASQLGISSDRLQQAMGAARAQAGMATPGTRPPNSAGPRAAMKGGPDLSTAAQAIGISVEQLRQELPGKSLAAVAQAHGKNPADVAAALKAAAGQRIDERMNRVAPTPGPGGFPGRNGTGISPRSGTPGTFPGIQGPSGVQNVTPRTATPGSQVTPAPTRTVGS
jgi:hypothetical protein